MQLGTIFANHYSEFIRRQLHIPHLFVDLLLWCRQKKFPVRLVVEEAFVLEEDPLPENWFREIVHWASFGNRINQIFPLPEDPVDEGEESEDRDIPGVEDFERIAAERAEIFQGILATRHADESSDELDLAIALVRELIAYIDDPADFIRIAKVASRELDILMDPDERMDPAFNEYDWYSFDAYERSFDAETLPAFCQFAGVDPAERPAIHGSVYFAWAVALEESPEELSDDPVAERDTDTGG
ncbi:MAG: hypothetical protein IT428_07180 [Planctomycetaceae bacterium]|nr:hypothetical protein [Planctomycetaceae bacterium]